MTRPELTPGEILYRDEHVLVVNKPAGVPVHGSRMLEGRPDTLLSMARSATGRMVHAAHRLDRPVSGALVLAFDLETLAALSLAFEQREVYKQYLAVVRGWTDEEGVIDHPLRPPRDERRTNDEARDARTRFRRVATVELPFAVAPYATARYSLVELQPETGRRHQLRRHMKHISHHLVGDTTYGKGEHNRLFRDEFDCERLLLHSSSLAFRHPSDGQEITVTAPLDGAFNNIADLFRDTGGKIYRDIAGD
jgi:tRNA pseudouridine65 synthase